MQVCLIKAQVKSGAVVHSEWWRIRPGFKATRSRWGEVRSQKRLNWKKKYFALNCLQNGALCL